MFGYWPVFIVLTSHTGGGGDSGSIANLLFKLTLEMVVNLKDILVTTLWIPETYWKFTVFRCILLSFFIPVLMVLGMVVLFISGDPLY